MPRTGKIDQGFVPAVNGEVDAIAPGPGNNVYVAGKFTTVNGASTRVDLLDATTGQRVPGWTPPVLNGITQTLTTVGGNLYIGGAFTTAKTGSADDDPQAVWSRSNGTTGAVIKTMTVQLTGRHGTGSRQGPLGPKKLAVSPDGTQMVVIGNFTDAADSTTAPLQHNDQVVRLNLTQPHDGRRCKATGRRRSTPRNAPTVPSTPTSATCSSPPTAATSSSWRPAAAPSTPTSTAAGRCATPRRGGRPSDTGSDVAPDLGGLHRQRHVLVGGSDRHRHLRRWSSALGQQHNGQRQRRRGCRAAAGHRSPWTPSTGCRWRGTRAATRAVPGPTPSTPRRPGSGSAATRTSSATTSTST